MEDDYIEFTREELEDIREGITEETFELKQFAILRVPVIALFERRIKRLRELAEYQKDLFPDEYREDFEFPEMIPFIGTYLEGLFNSYYENKNALKKQLFASTFPYEIACLMEKMCANEKAFGKVFDFVELDDKILISKEPDPMVIYTMLEQMKLKQLIKLEDVKNRLNDVPESLHHEFKRLHLLATKY